MDSSRTVSLPRCGAVWLGGSVAAGALVVWLLPTITAGLDPVHLDQALVWLCAVVAAVVAAWLWLVIAIVTVEALTGRTDPTPGVPAPVRRVVLAACGVALVGGLATPAFATPGDPHEARGSVSLAGLPLPDRAVSAALPGGAHVHTGPVRSRDRTVDVVVAPGDSLWAIASRDLGPGASDAQIADRTYELYRLNLAQIGPDPDLIQPATRLRLH